jgi:hypothetical protein
MLRRRRLVSIRSATRGGGRQSFSPQGGCIAEVSEGVTEPAKVDETEHFRLEVGESAVGAESPATNGHTETGNNDGGLRLAIGAAQWWRRAASSALAGGRRRRSRKCPPREAACSSLREPWCSSRSVSVHPPSPTQYPLPGPMPPGI